MRILLATGIYPPHVGGPALYSVGLNNALNELGHKVIVLTYTYERSLPPGLRHFAFFLKMCFFLRRVDAVMLLDTLSVGFPGVVASRLFGKTTMVRTGGDFLWESYVNRTGSKVKLSNFYRPLPGDLNIKEKIIFRSTRYILNRVDSLVFSTKFQYEIFRDIYKMDASKVTIIENHYGKKQVFKASVKKNFLFAGRNIFLKNTAALKKAFASARHVDSSIILDVVNDASHDELLKKISRSYAVIVPSLSEISPNIILECIMYNKPFILTDDNGLMDRLSGIGMYCNPLDVNDISKKILALSEQDIYQLELEKIKKFRFEHSYLEIAQEMVQLFAES